MQRIDSQRCAECLESSGSALSFLPRVCSSQAAFTTWKQIWLFPRLFYQAVFGLGASWWTDWEFIRSKCDIEVLGRKEKKRKGKRTSINYIQTLYKIKIKSIWTKDLS